MQPTFEGIEGKGESVLFSSGLQNAHLLILDVYMQNTVVDRYYDLVFKMFSISECTDKVYF